MFPLDLSDIALSVDLFLAIGIILIFSLGRPRIWYRDRLGWVIFSLSLAVIALLALIVYAVVFNEKIPEPVRLVVSVGLGAALIAQAVSFHRERRAGREAASARTSTPERDTMSKLNVETVATVTEIWYKGQRVIRTLAAVIIPAFLSFALVLPAIIEAAGLPVDSELRLWLVGVGGGVTAVAAAITRIMAIPAVNAWLTKLGLGSVPAKAIVTETDTTTGAIEILVAPDPKALNG